MYMFHRDIQNLDIIYFGFKSLIHNYILLLLLIVLLSCLMRTHKSLSDTQNYLIKEHQTSLLFWGFRQSLDKVFCHLTIITHIFRG
jgi:hypothetical protein